MNINNGGAPRAHEETMSHYHFDRPGFLAIAPDAYGRTFAAAPRGGIPNQMIKPPARATAPKQRAAAGDPPERKGRVDALEKRDSVLKPKQRAEPPRATLAAAPSLAALRAENARLRAEIATREKASKAPPAPTGPKLLTGREREEMDRAMGITRTRATGPGLDELGRFVLAVETPTQTRARLARAGKVA